MPTIAEVRAKYPQYDDMSDVELAGALHDRFYSDMPADQFAEKIGLKPDKYQQAAIDDKAAGKPMGETRGAAVEILKSLLPPPTRVAAGAIGAVDDATGGQLSDLARLGQQGASFNSMDEIKAGIETPLEMYRRGTLNPLEAYNYTKARENLAIDDARRNTGYAGTAAELLGGAAGGLGLVKSGMTAGRLLTSAAPGLLGRTAVGAADAAAMGGVAGFNEGDSLSARLGNAGHGAAVGGLVGGALPLAGAAASGTLSPFISNIMARIDPARYARSQVARGISESGRSVDDIAGDLASAANEGQGVYTLADAMGNPGQRLLSTTARAPGPGRTAVVDFLENRQAGQGRRVSNALSEGFGSRMTPEELRANMTAERGAVADEAYGAVRNEAGPVNVRDVVDHIEANVPAEPAAPDTISGRLQRYQRMLSSGDAENPQFLTDFEQVQRVRSELSDEIQTATQGGQRNRARMLGQVLTRLDDALEASSEGFRQANRDFAAASRNIDAIDEGRLAATRGRTEDTIPAYQGLSPRGQQAYRTGYVDPLIANTQGAAFGANKARPLLNDAFAAEAEAMAPGNAQMQRRLSREQRMFETRNQALGNSKTAENLADADAMGIDPSVVGHIFQGNYGQAVRSLISAGSNVVTGNTPQVREAVANILLQRGGTMTAAELNRMVGETVRKIQFVQDLARTSMAAGSGALAAADQKKINKRAKKIFGVN